MINKLARLASAFSNEAIRRLPYIIVLLLLIWGIQLFRLSSQSAEGIRIGVQNSADSKVLLKRVAALSEDNKRLSQQNVRLAQQNADQLACIAKLFALSDRPVTVDLDNCFILALARNSSTPSQNGAPQSSAGLSVPSSSSSQNNANGSASQPDNSQPENPPDPPMEVLGVPVCLPFTDRCVR